MRETWLGNGNKAYPWHIHGVFTDPIHGIRTSLPKSPIRYQNNIQAMTGVNNSGSARAKKPSPRKQEEDRSTWRTVMPIPPAFNESPKPSKKRSSLTPTGTPNLSDMIAMSPTAKQFKNKGNTSKWNRISTDSPFSKAPSHSSSTIKNKKLGEYSGRYKDSQISTLPTPAKPPETERKPPRHKPEYYSQIACLPGTAKTPTPYQRPPSCERNIKRNLMTSPEMHDIHKVNESPRRAKAPSPGRDMSKSSYDIICDALQALKKK